MTESPPGPPPGTKGSRPRWAAGAAGLIAVLIALVLQLAFAIRSDGLTTDELVYIAAGWRQLSAGDHSFNYETPPLAKLLAAAAASTLRLRDPPVPPGGVDLEWAYRFFHVENEPGPVLWRARIPAAAFTVLLAVGLWAWARSAHGPLAGHMALLLAAFYPSLLAHGHLATTDLIAAALMALASWAFWRGCERPTLGRAVLVGLALGAAASTRLTALALIPAFGALAAVTARSRHPAASERITLRRAALLGVVGAAMIVGVIWAAYGFRGAGAPAPALPSPWEATLGRAGRLLSAVRSLHLLPDPYVDGMRFQLAHNAYGHRAYLLGQHSSSGWPHYFLVAFLVKSTPGFLLALALSLPFAWRRWRAAAVPPVELHWAVAALAVGLMSSAGHVQIGERYLLPVYPWVILLAAAAAPALAAQRWSRAVLALALLLHVAPTVASARHGYLTYFNELAGGWRHGHRWLLDSNLDWGQDLPRLAAWMRRHGVDHVQLGYEGRDSPDRYGIRHEDLPGRHVYPAQPPVTPFQGTVAVSPNLLLGHTTWPRPNPYAVLDGRQPDDRAGVFFIYSLPAPPAPAH